MDCSYPSASVATRLLPGLPKSRRGFAGIHHRIYIETGAPLLTICWVATVVSFFDGRRPSPDTNHSSVSGTEGSDRLEECLCKKVALYRRLQCLSGLRRRALALRIFESDTVRFVFLPAPLLFLSFLSFPHFHPYFLQYFLFYPFFLFLPFVLFHFLPS